MALLELDFIDKAQLEKEGRCFTCSRCPDRTKKLRRCEESRDDFTDKDNVRSAIWPLQLRKGGEKYGFCPAKASWDSKNTDYYDLLIITAETGVMPRSGGILDQDNDFVENLSWFIRRWDMLKFTQKAEMILGKGSGSSKSVPNLPNKKTR